jgi:hypothetical protein
VVDYYDENALYQRAQFVEQVMCWAGEILDPALLDAVLDALPIGHEHGWVVAWIPYSEGDYETRWCMTKLGVWWSLFRARLDRSLMSFVLDVELASGESELGSWCYEEDG